MYVVSSEMRYIRHVVPLGQLSARKLFFGCVMGFSTANLPELLCVVVGADIVVTSGRSLSQNINTSDLPLLPIVHKKLAVTIKMA
jgi:hypothetical protein